MTVTLLLFGPLATAAGERSVRLELPGDRPTCADVRRALLAARPEVAGLAGAARFAVDREFVPDTHPVEPGAEVALLPPVSGG